MDLARLAAQIEQHILEQSSIKHELHAEITRLRDQLHNTLQLLMSLKAMLSPLLVAVQAKTPKSTIYISIAKLLVVVVWVVALVEMLKRWFAVGI